MSGDGGGNEGNNDNEGGVGINADTSGVGQQQGPGIGLNDTFGATPDSQMSDIGNLGSGFGISVNDALGNTSMGSFGLGGVTSNTNAPGTSTSFGGAVTDLGSVPGYEGPGPSVGSSVFGGPTNDLSPTSTTPDKALGATSVFDSVTNPMTNPNTTLSQAFSLNGFNPNSTTITGTINGTATSTGLANTQSIGAMGLGTIGSTIGSTTNPSTELSPSTSTPSSTSTSTSSSTTSPSTSTPSTSNPTANSSTTKGPGLDVTGISLVDGFLSNLANNPVSAVTNAVVGVVGGPLGVANSISGLLGGPTIGGAVSSAIGTGSGYGNTVTSSSDNTAPSGSNPNGGGPSTSDLGPSGNDTGGISTLAPSTTVTGKSTGTSTAIPVLPDTFVAYDTTKKESSTPVYASYDWLPQSNKAAGITALGPQGASFSDKNGLQFGSIPEYPNLSNTNQGILDAFPVQSY